MLGHSTLYLAIRVANGLLALAALFVLTRLMGAEQYGRYALGLAAVGVGATVIFQWLNAALARFYPAHRSDPVPLLRQTRRLFGALAALAVTAGLLVGMLQWQLAIWPPGSAALIAAAVAGIVGMGWHNLHVQLANARGEPLRYGLITTTRAAAALATAVLVVGAGHGAAGALAGIAIGCALAVACFGARLRGAAAAPDPALRTALLSYGMPLSLTYVCTVVVDWSDRFVIAASLGAAAVGAYAAAYDLAQQTAGALLNVFFLAHYPRVTQAWESGGAAAARAAMLPLANGLLLCAPLVCGVFVGLAPEIAAAMFGPELRAGATQVMPWVAIAVTIGAFRAFLFDIAFHLVRASRLQLGVIATMAVANVGLNLLLIPYWGLLGAAIAATLAFALGTVASAWWGRRLQVYPPLAKDLARALLVAALLAGVLRGSAPWGSGAGMLALRGTIGLVAFVLALWLTDLAGARSRWRRSEA